MSNFKNIPICYQHKCRVPYTWEKIGLKKCNTIKECEDFCNNNTDCKSCVTSSEKNYIWAVNEDEDLFRKKTLEHPCRYEKSEICYVNGPTSSWCDGKKAYKNWKLGCTLPNGKVWGSYSVKGNTSPYKSLEQCSSFCDRKTECKSCAKQRNVDNYWYPMTISAVQYNGPAPNGDKNKTEIDVYDKPVKCEPGVSVYSKCSQAPKLRISNPLEDPPPWFGYYYLDILNDNFDIGSELKKVNGVVFTNQSFNNGNPTKMSIKCIEKSLKKLEEMGLKGIILFYPAGHTQRDWLEKSPNSVFEFGKIVKKYRSTVLGIMISDEPLNNLYWIWKDPLSGNKSKRYPHKGIYPENENYDNKKYISRYLSLAKDVTSDDIEQCNLVTSYADVYALFKTDMELLRDIFGSCMNFITIFAGQSSSVNNNNVKCRFDGTGIPPKKGNRWNMNPAKYSKDKKLISGGWDMLQLPWSYIVNDIPIINWVGTDWYTNAVDNPPKTCNNGVAPNGPTYKNWKPRQDALLNALPKTSKSVVILQSSNNQVGQCSKNTCDKEGEKCLLNYNKAMLSYISNNGGNKQFPLQLVYAAPVSCDDHSVNDKECPDIWGSRAGQKCFLKSSYQRGETNGIVVPGAVLGTRSELYNKEKNYYKCFFNPKDSNPKLPTGISCPYQQVSSHLFECGGEKICGFDKANNPYFIDMHCGDKNCFLNSPNTIGLINNASKNVPTPSSLTPSPPPSPTPSPTPYNGSTKSSHSNLFIILGVVGIVLLILIIFLITRLRLNIR